MYLATNESDAGLSYMGYSGMEGVLVSVYGGASFIAPKVMGLIPFMPILFQENKLLPIY